MKWKGKELLVRLKCLHCRGTGIMDARCDDRWHCERCGGTGEADYFGRSTYDCYLNVEKLLPPKTQKA